MPFLMHVHKYACVLTRFCTMYIPVVQAINELVILAIIKTFLFMRILGTIRLPFDTIIRCAHNHSGCTGLKISINITATGYLCSGTIEHTKHSPPTLLKHTVFAAHRRPDIHCLAKFCHPDKKLFYHQ